MENFVNKELDEIITYIKNSSNYKKCISIKKKMSSNSEICKLIEDVKFLQKKYVKSSYMDQDTKKLLDMYEERLNQIPIYVLYNNYLREVNDMIDLVRDEINDYFTDIVFIDIKSD